MGIHDRDYVREKSIVDEWSPSRRGTIGLIVFHVLMWVVFAGMARSGDKAGIAVFTTWPADPHAIWSLGEFWRIATASLLHVPFSVWHLVFTMVVLWFVGRSVEARLGTRRFLLCFSTLSVASALGYALAGLAIPTLAPAVGTDGAICGLLAMTAFHRPREIINIFGVLSVPRALAVFVWIATWSFNGIVVGRGAAGIVPLAGFACGAGVLVGWLWHRYGVGVPGGSPRPRTIDKESEPLSLDRIGLEQPAIAASDKTRKRVDKLLAKISMGGIESLSAEEQAFLQSASSEYQSPR